MLAMILLCLADTCFRQTQQIDQIWLPVLPNTLFPLAKKADLALAFCPYHPDVGGILKTYAASHLGIPMSQMQDAYTSTVPLVCGMEVKEAGGDYNEAVMQLAIWSAAGLAKLKTQVPDPHHTEMPPSLGWTVIGHEWKLHIAWKEADGRVVSTKSIS